MKHMRKIVLQNLLIIPLFLYACSTSGITIIFDLEGILIKKNSYQLAKEIGFEKFIGWYNPLGLEEKLFGFLSALADYPDDQEPLMYKNMEFPYIMCQWLSGHLTNEEIRSKIDTVLEANEYPFTHRKDRKLVRDITNVMFNKDRFAKTFSPIKKNIKILKKIRKKEEKTGEKHTIILLSNWDQESFEVIRQHKNFEALFDLSDGWVISGNVGMIKPHQEIFHLTFDQYNLDPDTELTLYVDDQESNIVSAQKIGKKCLLPILCKDNNLKSVKKLLEQYQVI